MELEKLPNIGKEAAKKLQKVGINASEDLIATGSKAAFLKIRTQLNDGCLHLLYALEGAVQGIPKKELSKEKKSDLKKFFNELNLDK